MHEELEDSVIEDKELANTTSEAVQDLISADPGFIVRHGTMIMLLVVVLFFILTCFIKYPDTVICSARLANINAPKPVITRESGKLISLDIADGKTVKENDIIGAMEPAANVAAVLKLEEKVAALKKEFEGTDHDALQNIKINFNVNEVSVSQLGRLQPSFQTFVTAYMTLLDYIANGMHAKKLAILKSDLNNLKKAASNLAEKRKLYDQDIAISKEAADNSKIQLKDHKISEQEYRQISSQLISKKISIPEINTLLLSNESQQNDKIREILTMDNLITSQIYVFQQALNNFSKDIKEWKETFLLLAPVSGRLSYAFFLQENQQLQPNQTIAYVTPDNNSHYIQLLIPQNNLGKVAIGQKVLLKFLAYKWQEYGSVEGVIDYISQMPTDTSGYIAKVKLLKDLTTSYNKQIVYREGMVARAEIIVKDRTLFERLFMNMIKQD